MYLECPYCERIVRPGEEDHEEDVMYERECSECGMAFVYFIQYDPSYTSQKAPCLNGADHNFEKIKGYPTEYFKDKYRCSYCDKEETIPGFGER